LGATLLEEEVNEMSELEILRKGFIAFLDGLWWALRNTVGALSMYEGYMGGFKQLGQEAAETAGAKGPEAAARTAAETLRAIGLEVEQKGKEIDIKSCPLWNRILKRGLEYAFHIEEICYTPLLTGIGQKAGAKPVLVSSLRDSYLERVKLQYKLDKVKSSLDKGETSQAEYNKQRDMLEQSMARLPRTGRYRFE
jgi:hypothetical protein